MNEVEISKQLRAAAREGDIQKFLTLVDGSHERLHQMTPFGTWLHMAAKAGHVDLVQRLLSLGIDINTKGGTFGGSALNLAAAYGQLPVVKFLLDAGAEMDVTESARNPLFSAVQGGHLDIVKLLIERGIDHSIRYTGEFMKDMNALAFADERGQTEIAAYLSSLQ